MTTFLTLAFRHASPTKAEVLVGTDAAVTAHDAAIREFLPMQSHPDFCRVETWSSDGGKARTHNLTKSIPKKTKQP